jgi:hypothetical protein
VEAEQRDRLLTTLGLFGVRLGVDAVATGKVSNSQELAELLDTVSGIAAVRGALNDRFGRRSGLLKMRTALQALRSLVRREKSLDGQAAALERIASGSLDGAHLRLLDQLPSLGWGEEVIEEIERLIGEGAPHERLGIPEGDDIRAEIATRVGEWRKRALHPAASPEAVDAAETMARTYEVLHAEVSQGGG